LANLYDESNRILELTLITIADGSTKVIKSYSARSPASLLSPDGKTVAYSREIEPGSSERSLYVIDMATGLESLIPTPSAGVWANAWTPDSKALLYEADRLGKSELWMIRIASGQPQGEPRLLRTDWSPEDTCITRDGTLYYGTCSGGPRAGLMGVSRIYTAALDLEKGIATAALLPAERLAERLEFSAPQWSPDGHYLAYRATGDGQTRELRIVHIASGKIRTLKPAFHLLNNCMWSPDGKEFITVSQQQPRRTGIYRINVATGNVTTVVEPADGPTLLADLITAVRWSADGREIYYLRRPNRLICRNLQTGDERDIIGPDNGASPLLSLAAPSPGGRQLRINFFDDGSPNVISKLLDLESGKIHDLWTLPRDVVTRRHWTFRTPDMRNLIYLEREASHANAPAQLWTSLADGSQAREIKVEGVEARFIQDMALHSDGRQLVFTTAEPRKFQLWALENFLPPTGDAK